eukprot:6630729-Alexandrium_andersonii.AAC.1
MKPAKPAAPCTKIPLENIADDGHPGERAGVARDGGGRHRDEGVGRRQGGAPDGAVLPDPLARA